LLLKNYDDDKKTEIHWHGDLIWLNVLLRARSERFGVKDAMYMEHKNATAGPQSDIDLLIHFQGSESSERPGTLVGGLEFMFRGNKSYSDRGNKTGWYA